MRPPLLVTCFFPKERLSMPQILKPADLFRTVQERIDSHEWWIMPITNADGVAMCQEILRRFYIGKDPSLCALVLLPVVIDGQPLALLLASKACMSSADLAEAVDVTVPRAKADLLVPATTPLSALMWLWSTFRWEQAA
jgi:hypothetical protein